MSYGKLPTNAFSDAELIRSGGSGLPKSVILVGGLALFALWLGSK